MTGAVVMRLLRFAVIMAVLAFSGYTLVDKARTGDLSPADDISESEARLELKSAQYVLTIVAGQLARVHVITGQLRRHTRGRPVPARPAGMGE